MASLSCSFGSEMFGNPQASPVDNAVDPFERTGTECEAFYGSLNQFLSKQILASLLVNL